MNRVDLADSLRLLKKISDEAHLILEPERLPEEGVWDIFEWHRESWEPTENRFHVRNGLEINQRSYTKGRNLEQDWDTVLSAAKENGWTKDKDDMTNFWKERSKDRKGRT